MIRTKNKKGILQYLSDDIITIVLLLLSIVIMASALTSGNQIAKGSYLEAQFYYSAEQQLLGMMQEETPTGETLASLLAGKPPFLDATKEQMITDTACDYLNNHGLPSRSWRFRIAYHDGPTSNPTRTIDVIPGMKQCSLSSTYNSAPEAEKGHVLAAEILLPGDIKTEVYLFVTKNIFDQLTT